MIATAEWSSSALCRLEGEGPSVPAARGMAEPVAAAVSRTGRSM